MKLNEAMRIAHNRKDGEMAEDINNFCHYRLGWKYKQIVKAFAKSIGKSEDEGRQYWEDLMYFESDSPE